jgi:pSer/pThr/pTyr-binding forkhead associated (FHA) protein
MKNYYAIQLWDGRTGQKWLSKSVPRHSPIVVGRNPRYDLCLPLSTVSRKHLEFRVMQGKIVVRDLGSSCGTFLGQARLKRKKSYPISEGQPITIGNSTLVVRITSPGSLPEDDKMKTVKMAEHWIDKKTGQFYISDTQDESNTINTLTSAIPGGERAGYIASLSSPLEAAIGEGILDVDTSNSFRRWLFVRGGLVLAVVIAIAVIMSPFIGMISRQTAAIALLVYLVFFFAVVHWCSRSLPRNPFD